MKADGVRIVANTGIKLVTLGHGESNQFGNKVNSTTGVDIIAGNSEDSLEPMVKGYMLADALREIIAKINQVSGIVNSHLINQTQINAAFTGHFHTVPFGAAPSPLALIQGPISMISDVVQCIAPAYLQKVNTAMTEIDLLEPMGAGSFSSRFNNVN